MSLPPDRDKKGTASATEGVAQAKQVRQRESWLNVVAAVRQVAETGISDEEFSQLALEFVQRGARDHAAPEAPEESIADPARVKSLDALFAASHQLMTDWMPRRDLEQLLSSGGRKDIENLCAAGCHSALLVGLLTALHDLKSIERDWADVVGPEEQREGVSLEATIERHLATLVNDETAHAGAVEVGRLPPRRLVSELRLYGLAFDLPKLVADDISLLSLKHLLLLVLASYVERATGTSHHGPLSTLVAEICSDAGYTADAQRQWRYRNRHFFNDPHSIVWRIADSLRNASVG